jgi:benzil reductase ((S)-benzoin forming)
MKLFIITGASKGLGRAFLEKSLREGHFVISFSRSAPPKHTNHLFIKHDLGKTTNLEKKFKTALAKIKTKKFDSIHLINNAAIVGPIGPVENHSLKELQNHININLVTPIFLNQLFVKNFKKKMCPKTITNISSGAALRPIEGWSFYCATKSGLRMFSECLDLETQSTDSTLKVLSFSPGVMDTDMQVDIRRQKEKNFSRVNEFRDLKEKNLLLSADKVAGILFDLLNYPEKINKNFYDVKEF